MNITRLAVSADHKCLTDKAWDEVAYPVINYILENPEDLYEDVLYRVTIRRGATNSGLTLKSYINTVLNTPLIPLHLERLLHNKYKAVHACLEEGIRDPEEIRWKTASDSSVLPPLTFEGLKSLVQDVALRTGRDLLRMDVAMLADHIDHYMHNEGIWEEIRREIENAIQDMEE